MYTFTHSSLTSTCVMLPWNPTRTLRVCVLGQSHPSTPQIDPTLRVLDCVFEVIKATIVTLRCEEFARGPVLCDVSIHRAYTDTSDTDIH